MSDSPAHQLHDLPDYELPESRTGIEGFDEITRGGLPTGRLILAAHNQASGDTKEAAGAREKVFTRSMEEEGLREEVIRKDTERKARTRHAEP